MKGKKLIIIICIELLIIGVMYFAFFRDKKDKDKNKAGITEKIIDANGQLNTVTDAEKASEETEQGTPTDETTETAEAENSDIFSYPEIDFEPHAVPSTEPTNLLLSTEIIVDDNLLENKDDYAANYSLGDIEFETGSKYTDVEGVVTFRGNNFRDNPTYGRASFTSGGLEGLWSQDTGSITYNNATWSGSGWTGQPLMRKWSKETKAHMNMYESAKNDDDLVEVIYACMDGYIYFLNMKTGEPTRDRFYLGWTFKGSGALDPRGYPIMYLGAGYDSNEGKAHAFIINLLDCSVMYEFGQVDPFSLRGTLSYFDSSAVVDPETDTLIYPGENGLLYLIHLGTHYDEAAGTLSLDLDKVVKWRYSTKRNTTEQYWLGMETSAAIYKHYLFIADNGANLFCIDLNTLKTVWVQDILDDSNSTPVLSIENDHLYIYVSTSFHLGWRSSSTVNIPIWKIDAETGEIIWQTEYECNSIEGVSGGVQSTIAVGRSNLDEFIYVTVAMTHGTGSGDTVCLKKADGTKQWEVQTPYTWSSPICVYNQEDQGEVIYATSDGMLRVADGVTGEEKSRLAISDGTIEASPAVYENNLVIGTRAGKIWGVELK